RVYVFLGGANGLAATPTTTLTELDGHGGDFGISVASAGDVNGDGYADLIVGAENAGGAYLYMGDASGLSITPAVALNGPAYAADFGTSVAGAGDVNGDGYADVLIGAPYGGRAVGGMAIPGEVKRKPPGIPGQSS